VEQSNIRLVDQEGSGVIGVCSMCEYSLHDVPSRPAKVGDELVTKEFSMTRGFAAVGEHGAKLVIHDSPPDLAVCLLPGTELAFEDDVFYLQRFGVFGKAHVSHKVARFRQIDIDDPRVQHDALEFPNGQVVKLTHLIAGQSARVLQLPIAVEHHEHMETGHVTRSVKSRIDLNRETASILMPNQGAVMLWRAVRGTAIRVSAAIMQSFRYFNRYNQHSAPAGVEEEIDAIKSRAVTVKLPRNPAAQMPDKKIEAAA
jgi:hypothetical protein